MAYGILWLSRLPVEDQLNILEEIEKLSKIHKWFKNDDLEDEDMVLSTIDMEEEIKKVPLEINGNKYWVDKEVLYLIESLHKQLSKKK
jgi:hypothetical protein